MRVSCVQEEQLCLHDLMSEFISCKQAQKARERTVKDYRKYFDAFLQFPRSGCPEHLVLQHD